MRNLIYTVIALLICAAFTFVLIECLQSPGSEAAGSWLAVAGLIVTASALSQIVFAVVAYMESAALRTQIRDAHHELSQVRVGYESAMRAINLSHYDSCTAWMKAVMTSLHHLAPSEGFEPAMHQLRKSQIEIELAHGSCESLWRAMESATKLGKKYLLEIQDVVIDKARLLDSESEQSIRKQLRVLLKINFAD